MKEIIPKKECADLSRMPEKVDYIPEDFLDKLLYVSDINNPHTQQKIRTFQDFLEWCAQHYSFKNNSNLFNDHPEFLRVETIRKVDIENIEEEYNDILNSLSQTKKQLYAKEAEILQHEKGNKRLSKILKTVIIVLIGLLIAFFVCLNNGSILTGADAEQRVTSARQEAYNNGYSDGKEYGHTSGYEEGKTDGFEEGYQSGKEDGYDSGYWAGVRNSLIANPTPGRSSNSGGSGSGYDTRGAVDSEPTVEGMVWLPTNGGKKYHSEKDCSGMIDPKQVPIEDAIKSNFTPCSKCYKSM